MGSDPGPEITWTETIATARLLREVLDTLGLTSWVKTTGGRGLHIVVPIAPARNWLECLDFSREVSEAIVRSNPALFTITFSRQGRERKILLDYLRNNRTNTSICAYSPRAREGAPVSVPIDWSELRAPQKIWTLASVPKRLARLRVDPWAGYWTAKQRISPRAFAAVTKI